MATDGETPSDVLDTYENPRPDDELSKCHQYNLTVYHLDDYTYGEINVEYRPDAQVVDESGLEFYLDTLCDEVHTVEDLVARVYHALVAVLYPGEADYDRPWRYCPLVVDFEYHFPERDVPDAQTHSISLGTYR